MIYDLTIIIPVFNTEKYLHRCLDSIVNQENIEEISLRVICVNDGSTDQSLTILEKYAEIYPFIEIISKKNGGVSSARNTGLSAVHDSEYVTFIDPDDTISSNYLHEFFKNKGSDVIYFDFDLVDTQNDKIKHLEVNPYFDLSNSVEINKRYFMLTKHASWTRIYRTELMTATFPDGKIYEDIALMPYITSKCLTVSYIKSYLYQYSIDTSGSIMNSNKSNIFDVYDSLEYLFNLFGTDFETYKEELQYLAIEHLCVGHTYRLLNYEKTVKQDFQDIIQFMEKYFGKNWNRNKYVEQGVQKVNINSKLSHVVPVFLKLLKSRMYHLFLIFNKLHKM